MKLSSRSFFPPSSLSFLILSRIENWVMFRCLLLRKEENLKQREKKKKNFVVTCWGKKIFALKTEFFDFCEHFLFERNFIYFLFAVQMWMQDFLLDWSVLFLVWVLSECISFLNFHWRRHRRLIVTWGNWLQQPEKTKTAIGKNGGRFSLVETFAVTEVAEEIWMS